MFIGQTFTNTVEALNLTPIKNEPITTLAFSHMILDEMYLTRNVLIQFNWNFPKDWTFDTFLHALFQNSTMAGNVSYSESIVSKIKIKKRYQGEFKWRTIFEKDINDNEDFAIEFYDYFSPANRTVEYAYVAVVAGAETTPISTSVFSTFDSYFICNKETSHPMTLDTGTSLELNRSTSVIQTIGSRYPFVVSNGTLNYYSGTLTATFIEFKDEDYDVEHGWDYRNKMDAYLTDGTAKILKTFEGDMWMVNIVDNIPRTENGHYQNVSHTINWVECGDPNDTADLYRNGFIDVHSD